MEKLYTISEAAEAMRVTRQTIYNWHKDGVLPFVRVNGHPRITKSALQGIMTLENAEKDR